MSLFPTLRTYVDEHQSFSLATVIAGPGLGTKFIIHPDGRREGVASPPNEIAEEVVRDGVALLAQEGSDTRVYDLRDGDSVEIFFDSYTPPRTIVIVGAVEAGQALTRLAKQMGYRVLVTDARAAFATRQRFPEADEVIKGWPQDVLPGMRFDESTYVVLLSHDPKFDEPTLHHVLPLSVKYVGAIGSRRTQAQRRQRLLDQGFSETDLHKLYGPVGLDLGGRSAEETALAILAEITCVRHGKTGGMMSRPPTTSVKV